LFWDAPPANLMHVDSSLGFSLSHFSSISKVSFVDVSFLFLAGFSLILVNASRYLIGFRPRQSATGKMIGMILNNETEL
jgi:hypothetical protein